MLQRLANAADLPTQRLSEMKFGTEITRAGTRFRLWAPQASSVTLLYPFPINRLTIARALAGLAPGYRKIFLLHDVDGLQHREIAAIEGCSLGNSKSQLHKARRALRGVLTARANLGAGGLAEAALDTEDADLG